ncbi:uncharacterized protein LOC134034082 [Osmerus eperlanus]|uniref:uncharacterized protein LOC134034082 n=1 Tax=Osmerus eperlanus TaxID=29151 RepID=UPI002E11D815
MSLDVTFRLRVASIMESLTTSVVHEVCQVMEESLEAFRLEMKLREMERFMVKPKYCLDGVPNSDQEQLTPIQGLCAEESTLCMEVEDCSQLTPAPAAEEKGFGGISEGGILSTETIKEHEAVDQVHISVQKENTLPSVNKCLDCCNRYHCPFCKTSVFKPTNKYKLRRHLQSHLSRAVNYRGYSLFRCFLECSSSGHNHCPFCRTIILKKADFINHVTSCRASSPTTSQSNSAPSSFSTATLSSPTNQKRGALVSSASQTPLSFISGLSDVGQVRSSVASRETICHKCGLTLLTKNLRNHILRRHPDGGGLPRQHAVLECPRRPGVATATCEVCERVMCLKNLKVHMKRRHPHYL